MSNLLVTTINSANGTTDMTVATGNTSAPKTILYSNGAGSFTNGLVRSNGFINGSQTVVNTTTTLTFACFGTMVQFQSGPYTVTVPNPSFNGACFQVWTNTTATITLSTPANTFVGPNGSSASTVTLLPNSTYLLSSDGSNWIITNVNQVSSNYNWQIAYDKLVYSYTNTPVPVAALNNVITPRKASSRVAVHFNISYEAQYNSVFKLSRTVGGVETIITSTVDSNQWAGLWASNYDADTYSTMTQQHLFWLDSPNTTQSVQYKLLIQNSYDTSTYYLYLNRTYASTGQPQYEVAVSSCFLQEI